jgi:hypothetical protein
MLLATEWTTCHQVAPGAPHGRPAPLAASGEAAAAPVQAAHHVHDLEGLQQGLSSIDPQTPGALYRIDKSSSIVTTFVDKIVDELLACFLLCLVVGSLKKKKNWCALMKNLVCGATY